MSRKGVLGELANGTGNETPRELTEWTSRDWQPDVGWFPANNRTGAIFRWDYMHIIYWFEGD